MNSYQKGKGGEECACEFLKKQGYRIVARNFRTRHAEIDIIAEKDGRTCFIEVRSATTKFLHSPILTITYPKQRNLVRAAREYFYRTRSRERNSEFAVIGVVYNGGAVEIELFRDAFRASELERA